MSYLFGRKEFLCDGCATILPNSGRGFPRGTLLLDLDQIVELTTAPGWASEGELYTMTKRLDVAIRHFCPSCAPVALDKFRESFARPPLVRDLAEPEEGDPIASPALPTDPSPE